MLQLPEMLINANKLCRSLVIITFVVLIVIMPSVRLRLLPETIIWYMDAQRLLEMILLVFILLEAILAGVQPSASIAEKMLPSRVQYGLLLLVALSLVSTYFSLSPRVSIIEITTFIGLFYLTLFVAKLFHKNKEVFLKGLIYILWVSVLLYMVSFYVGYVTAIIFKSPLRWPMPFSGFSNIRHFNQYQAWGLGLIYLPLLCFDLKKNGRILLNTALVLWWAMLFYSASRGITIAWIAGMVITIAAYRNSALPFLRLHLSNAIVGGGIYYLLFKIVPFQLDSILLTGTVIRDVTNDRIELWKIALELIQNNPFLGVGPMHYAWYSATNAHPHNSVLQLAAEWGLIATLIILAIATHGTASWIKRFNNYTLRTNSNSDSSLAVVLFFSLAANVAYSLVDGVIVMPISQVLMFTIIGLMVAHCTYDKSASTSSNSTTEIIVASLTLAALIWSTMPEITKGLLGNEKGFSIGYTAAGPRYWREMK